MIDNEDFAKSYMTPLTDFLICEYPLPLPDEEEMTDSAYDWSEFQFNLEKVSCLEPVTKYQIGANGFLYKENILFEGKEAYEIEQQDEITHQLKFAGAWQGEKYDYTFEYSALFYKGELKEISLIDYEKNENEMRMGVEEKVRDHFLGRVKFFNSWYYRYLIGPIKKVFFWIFRVIFEVVNFINAFLFRLLLWLK